MRCPYIPIFQNKNYLNKLNTCNIGVKLTNDTLLRKKANILENTVAELYNYLKILITLLLCILIRYMHL